MNAQVNLKNIDYRSIDQQIASLEKEKAKINKDIKNYLESKAKIVRSVWEKCQTYNVSVKHYLFSNDNNGLENTSHLDKPSFPDEIRWAYYLKDATEIAFSEDMFTLRFANMSKIAVPLRFISGSDRDIAYRVRTVAHYERQKFLKNGKEKYKSEYVKELQDALSRPLSHRVSNPDEDTLFMADFLKIEKKIQNESSNYDTYMRFAKAYESTVHYINQRIQRKIDKKKSSDS